MLGTVWLISLFDFVCGHFFVFADGVEQEPMEDEGGFDGVCICTGTNTWASLPCFKGKESFKGEIMHSEKYRSAEVNLCRTGASVSLRTASRCLRFLLFALCGEVQPAVQMGVRCATS